MNATAKSLGIDRLSLAERILLVEDIWDSIAAEQNALPLPPEQRRELDRRLEAYRVDGNRGTPAGESIERIRRAV